MSSCPPSDSSDNEVFLWKSDLRLCLHHHPTLGFEDMAMFCFSGQKLLLWQMPGRSVQPAWQPVFPYGSKAAALSSRSPEMGLPWGPSAQERVYRARLGVCEYTALDRRNPATEGPLPHSMCSRWRKTHSSILFHSRGVKKPKRTLFILSTETESSRTWHHICLDSALTWVNVIIPDGVHLAPPGKCHLHGQGWWQDGAYDQEIWLKNHPRGTTEQLRAWAPKLVSRLVFESSSTFNSWETSARYCTFPTLFLHL